MAHYISAEIQFWIFRRDFLFRIFLLSSFDILSLAVGNQTHQVNGILGGSAIFSVNVPKGITVKKIEWDFRLGHGTGYWLGEFSHGNKQHLRPPKRFGQRLAMADEMTLRIKDLELNDGGIYNARIWLTKAQFQEQSFNLIVYEPVPTPQIHYQVESKAPGGCNVTLRCHTPGREELNFSWETGDPHRALAKSVNWYQVSDNGRELRVFSWSSSLDSEFTCQVSNPVDQKRASIDLLNICQRDEGGPLEPSSWISCVIPAFIVLLVIIVIVMWWKKRLKGHKRGFSSIMHKCGDSILSLQNSERSQTEDGDNKVDLDREDFSSSSTPAREAFPSLSSSAVLETEPSETEHCIPQSNMGDKAHLLDPLPTNPLKVSWGKDPLKSSYCCQLIQSYSPPSTPKHSSQECCDQEREQHAKTYPLTMASLRERSPRHSSITTSSQSI